MGKVTCIGNTHSESYYRTHISENGIFNLLVYLTDKLVGDDQIQLVFSCLGKYYRKIRRGKILKLINIKIKIPPCFGRGILAAHGRHENSGHQNEPQKTRVFLSQLSLGQIDKKNFAGIHNFSEGKRGLGLADYVSDHFVGNKSSELRNYIIQYFRLVEVRSLGNLVSPVAPDNWVCNFR